MFSFSRKKFVYNIIKNIVIDRNSFRTIEIIDLFSFFFSIFANWFLLKRVLMKIK